MAPLASGTAPASTSPLPPVTVSNELSVGFALCAALLTLASLGGFLLYYCGLTRAKNCAHTSTLLLVGALFGLTGYWIGGFAVQTGGIGDAHAALMQPIPPVEKVRSIMNWASRWRAIIGG